MEFQVSLDYLRLFLKNKKGGKDKRENTTDRVRENTACLVPFIVRQNIYRYK